MVRVLHCSDLHFGKRHGRFDEDLRGRLSEARFGQIDRLAAAARDGGATHVLVAGDVFDSAAPSAKTRRRVLQAVANSAPLIWVFMPGNHDPLSAETLWADLASDAPDNLTLALEPVPMALGDDLDLLPAPCTTKRPGRDLTAWMDQAETRANVQRLGLAHGAVVDFDERGGVIAPDRAQRANLAYLALGDWHGQLQVNPRCWYSGAAELDRFKANQSLGQALLVTLRFDRRDRMGRPEPDLRAGRRRGGDVARQFSHSVPRRSHSSAHIRGPHHPLRPRWAERRNRRVSEPFRVA